MSKELEEDYMRFEWSRLKRAWIIFIDRDTKLKIEDLQEIVREDPFIVRINPEKVR